MKTALYTITLFLFLLTLQISFFDVLFSHFLVPVVIVSAVVVWTVTQGFRQALWWILPALLLYELFTSGTLSLMSVYGVVLAYGISFLSRRTLIENGFAAAFFYSMVIEVSAFCYHVGMMLVFKTPLPVMSWQNWLFQLGVILVVFVLVRKVLLSFQRHLDTLRSDRALMIR